MIFLLPTKYIPRHTHTIRIKWDYFSCAMYYTPNSMAYEYGGYNYKLFFFRTYSNMDLINTILLTSEIVQCIYLIRITATSLPYYYIKRRLINSNLYYKVLETINLLVHIWMDNCSILLLDKIFKLFCFLCII